MDRNRRDALMDFTQTLHNDTYAFLKDPKPDLRNRRVLITGASKGLGQAMVIAFAAAGCSHICLLSRTSSADTVEKAKEAAHTAGHPAPDFLELTAEITSPDSVDAAAAKVASHTGSLDLLVNNAGHLENWRPLLDADPEEWWRSWEVNVKGTFLVMRAFLPLVLKSQQKTLLTITSAGAWCTMAGASGYQSSKTAQVRLNNFLVEEYGEKGLLAYTIHPGGVKTMLASNMPDHTHHLLSETPELVADTLVWLTRERREWLSDRYVDVTWDMEELLAKKDEIVSRNMLKLILSR